MLPSDDRPRAGVIDSPSPNHGPRPHGIPVDLVVLHYTGMPTADAALARLCDPAAGVSAHYLVDEDGTVFRLVEEARRAWHAGVSSWAGETDVNSRSIGIELVNPGHEFGYHAFREPQLLALEGLLGGICGRRRVDPIRVIGHADAAPMRKRDPGELFPWRRFAAQGLAYWPAGPNAPVAPDQDRARAVLARFGYRIGGEPDAFGAVIAAFQRRFRPSLCDGGLDGETMALIEAVERDLD